MGVITRTTAINYKGVPHVIVFDSKGYYLIDFDPNGPPPRVRSQVFFTPGTEHTSTRGPGYPSSLFKGYDLRPFTDILRDQQPNGHPDIQNRLLLRGEVMFHNINDGHGRILLLGHEALWENREKPMTIVFKTSMLRSSPLIFRKGMLVHLSTVIVTTGLKGKERYVEVDNIKMDLQATENKYTTAIQHHTLRELCKGLKMGIFSDGLANNRVIIAIGGHSQDISDPDPGPADSIIMRIPTNAEFEHDMRNKNVNLLQSMVTTQATKDLNNYQNSPADHPDRAALYTKDRAARRATTDSKFEKDIIIFPQDFTVITSPI